MAPAVKPIPAAVKEDVLKLLQEAKAMLQPYQLTLTDEEERRLAPTSMGRDSIAFVQQAGQLMTNYPDVLTRAITDAMIAEHPVLLQTFEDADDLMLEANAIRDLLKTVRKVAGNTAMGRARTAYRNGQDDKGRTPGLADLVRTMSERFDQDADADDSPDKPKQ
ncbi:hypothetical protein Q5H93_02240 [Hymenobacter sp. ASUV-10]|uniref:Terminase small subunit n=1 Tax=Hymenobacter aranciens TaxID=3063996 RepID=A0ABT9B6V9_9BACT|nr:hypothetical protein [Hymenobacter sp. ASUV-10]MDO7873535.1 hypothetical protein [Hymenobacter sp. ASUV-10]